MSSQQEQSDDESSEFVQQARWLLEWHDRRGEAITTRATAVLGFVGVVLALLLQAAQQEGFQPRWWTWVAIVITLLLLLTAGICAVIVVIPSETQMPSVEQLRRWWSEQIKDPSRDRNAAQIADSILFGQELTQSSPISTASRGATRRASWFKRSAIALLVALMPLALLIVDVLIRFERQRH
ncbi:MAG: hypothetical protein WA966_08775 [Ornithinimicrobium sp.]